MPRRIGRPATDPAKREALNVDELVDYAREGYPRKLIADMCGVTPDTLTRWMSGQLTAPTHDFVARFRAAEAAGALPLLKKARSSPQGAQWYIDKRYPHLFSADAEGAPEDAQRAIADLLAHAREEARAELLAELEAKK